MEYDLAAEGKLEIKFTELPADLLNKLVLGGGSFPELSITLTGVILTEGLSINTPAFEKTTVTFDFICKEVELKDETEPDSADTVEIDGIRVPHWKHTYPDGTVEIGYYDAPDTADLGPEYVKALQKLNEAKIQDTMGNPVMSDTSRKYKDLAKEDPMVPFDHLLYPPPGPLFNLGQRNMEFVFDGTFETLERIDPVTQAREIVQTKPVFDAEEL